jgi:hypothetical protein
MKPTLEELTALLDTKNKEIQRVQLAIHLNICPECGAELIEVEEHYTIGKWIFKTKEFRTIKKCKENGSHYLEVIYDSYFEKEF